ncbi:tRNA uridine-5-carboxymethylaminomethyl(34) synthesis GTPase MnmE [Oceanotoga sp. DSM 15011]|uniref:tRNA uridine-5-carboxymethylaminomethyl(34) synthesis GTPase MnmE n=1 Tax=Oceanotoga sp. DSM 15011 TaxID=2984951 RepID=UPI0021F40FDB|nr:tRNA uridine-5-carboxymethylaminomethyl(34) synthesis GTPase MnmE [Oceanotoga sp. DSM 15011]UYP00450.1 tRNA uridine-5-carboxymethylaminomethyl(34) synthesis GTPase MnmE [Oceanotoga sp. DSM 15011]
MIYDNIAAISSPRGIGAISVIRISGYNLLEILKKLTKKEKIKPKYMYYGWIYEEQEKIDEITFVYHENPNSYTGEDMIEIFGHGGDLITKSVFRRILKENIREALPGEFSKRAVLNKKMNLIKAQAINDIINSKTEYSLNASQKMFTGGISKKIIEIKEDILNISARLEVEMDYPEDIEEDTFEIRKEIENIKSKIENILKNSENGIIAFNGIKTTIVGKPNSGKSTLLNALLRKERAIVTDVPGTTRDTIEEMLNIKGILIKLIDTAGIRNTEDQIEKIGIERSKKAIEESDLVIFIIDGNKKFDSEDTDILQFLNEKKKEKIIALNKIDKEYKDIKIEKEKIIKISAKNKQIEDLEKEIYERYSEKLYIKEPTLTNESHKNILEKVLKDVKSALEASKNNLTNDFIMYDLRNSLESIYKLTGENYTDELLEKMFSNFCVGK